jgi:hypothetical protein
MVSEAVNTLRDEQVRRHFLAVLDSDQPAEKKYEELIAFFERYDNLLNEISVQSAATPQDASGAAQEVSRAAEKTGLWNPQGIRTRVEDCLRRALQRLRVCQHGDGGWGYYVEQSVTWGTAQVLLTLLKARRVLELDPPVDPLVVQARDWLKGHSSTWELHDIPSGAERSSYEACLAVRSLCEAGDASFHAVSRTLEWIVTNQNDDGGWDARIRRAEDSWPRRVYSEVGATRMAIQALVVAANPALRQVVSKSARWLESVQNEDGSWNSGSCHPGQTKPMGQPSISKTCDALQGIASAARAGIRLPKHDDILRRAVDWIMAREQLRRTQDGGQLGWGYDDPEMPDLDSTCLAMETLVSIPEASMPAVTTNAIWLMEAQYSEPGSVEDGKWSYGDTFRITAALLDYYAKIRDNALFTTAG